MSCRWRFKAWTYAAVRDAIPCSWAMAQMRSVSSTIICLSRWLASLNKTGTWDILL